MRVDALDDLAVDETSRSTPWAAGCCGPKLIVVGDVRRLVVGPGDRLLPDRRFGAVRHF